MGKHLKLSDGYSFSLTISRASCVIVLLIASILYGLAVCRPIIPLPDEEGKTRDKALKLYQTVVEQIQTGKSYYSVVGHELRRIGYPTRSVFNWRLPALAWFLGQLPSVRTGQTLGFILSMTTLLIWLIVLHQSQYAIWQFFLGGLFLSGPIIYSLFPGTFLLHEFWAGTLIAISLAAHANGWRYISIVSGLMALFLRELTLPFVCIMMVLAYAEGQRREALIWLIGLLIFGGELLFHWTIVSRLITENDKALQGGWIVFGGWPFVLNTAQMHPFFLTFPPWVIAIILPLALLGFAVRLDASGMRVAFTIGIYVLAFLIVGRPNDIAWGLMYAFIMPLGLLHVPYAIGKLWQPFQMKLHGKVQKDKQ
jgi:hypothetical protein